MTSNLLVSWFPGRLLSSQFSSKLEEFQSTFRRLREAMQESKLTQVAVQVGELAVQVGGLTDIQSKRLVPFLLSPRTLTPYFSLVSSEDSGILDRLKPAPRREGAAPCLPGTRMDVLQKIHHWIADNQAQNVLWLKGNPGAGKTAIASSLVSELGTNLGSRFFFKRDDAAVNDPVVLWRTVAYDLAFTDPFFKKILVDVLRGGERDPGGVNVRTQFKDLIESPCNTCSQGSPMRVSVVVLDALDECD